MPTVLDSFVLEIGMDPKNFTKGQQEAYDALKKTQDQALRGGKDIEESSKKSINALGGIKTQALELFAVFTGGKGLIQFAQDTVRTNSQLGRLERNLNISSSTISKWQGVARIFGGDAATMAQTFTTMTDAVEGFKVGAISPLIAQYRELSAAGGTVIDTNKNIDQTLLDISANLVAINAKNPALAGFYGRRIGIDPGLYDILVKGPAAVQQMLDKMAQLEPVTKKATDAAGDLEQRWNNIGNKTESFGRKILNSGFGEKVGEAADLLNLTPGKIWENLTTTGTWLGKSQTVPPNSTTPAAAVGGAFSSQSEKEAYIRAAAIKRGIDPDVAMRVARSEGFDNFQSTVVTRDGSREKSYGAFQLYTGGGLGNDFQKKTGLDPSDKNNERQGIDFALDNARSKGWGAFHGAKNNQISQWQGIGQGGSTSTTEVNINGPININAGPGADGKKMANDFTTTLKTQSFAAQANQGGV
jgi:hypothetical protein